VDLLQKGVEEWNSAKILVEEEDWVVFASRVEEMDNSETKIVCEISQVEKGSWETHSGLVKWVC
jgi:hypothetical protein